MVLHKYFVRRKYYLRVLDIFLEMDSMYENTPKKMDYYISIQIIPKVFLKNVPSGVFQTNQHNLILG
jgi:hypothetical protein